MTLEISEEFLEYLSYEPPNLILSIKIPNIIFRFRRIETELLDGFINNTGIEPLKDLYSKQLCGFTCLHFPVIDCARYFLINKHNGPYNLKELILAIKEFLLFKGKPGTLDALLNSIESEIDKNEKLILEYWDDIEKKFIPLTKDKFLIFFPQKKAN